MHWENFREYGLKLRRQKRQWMPFEIEIDIEDVHSSWIGDDIVVLSVMRDAQVSWLLIVNIVSKIMPASPFKDKAEKYYVCAVQVQFSVDVFREKTYSNAKTVQIL